MLKPKAEFRNMSSQELYSYCRRTWPDDKFRGRERGDLLKRALTTLHPQAMQATRMAKALKCEALKTGHIVYDV
jgi:hypothetical protein